MHEITIKCHEKLTRGQNFWIISVILPECRVENHGFASAQSLFRIVFRNIYLLSDLKKKTNVVHFNSGHNISKKRVCLFINRLNVIKEKAFTETGFCTLAASNVPVMISTGKNLVLWIFSYFNVVAVLFFCVFASISPSAIFPRAAPPLPKSICRRKDIRLILWTIHKNNLYLYV